MLRTKKIFNRIFIALIILQPILDLMILNNGNIGEVFGFTIPTLVRFGLSGILFFISIVYFKFERIHLWLLGYIGVIGIYFVFHHVHAMTFQSYVPGNFNYSVVSEAFYILRMFLPILIIYFVYFSDIQEKEVRVCIVGVSLIMSLLEIVSNILKIGWTSYTELPLEANIFDWFTNDGKYNYTQMAFKGPFFWSIISTVLVLVLPYLIYQFIKSRRYRYLLLSYASFLALYMFGTKATTFSVMIIFVIMIIMYLFFVIIKKEFSFQVKILIHLILLCAVSMVVFPFSPAAVRMNFNVVYEAEADAADDKKIPTIEKEDEEDESEEIVLSEDAKQTIIKFFEENSAYVSITEDFFLKAYPVKYDPVFWYQFYDQNVASVRMQNRIAQQAIFERVKEINNDPLDDWLGITYSRTSNIYNLERDFLYQYYSLGWIGCVLLLAPYILILLSVMGLMVIRFKTRCTMENCVLILGLGLTYCLAYYSGNVLENLGITIIIGLMSGYVLKINFKRINKGDAKS